MTWAASVGTGDPNNAEDAFTLVQKLHKAAIEYNCGIITVLHENPGSDYGKMRGHLGSQLERKAETALRLAKDTKNGIVTIWAERARHCMIPKSEGQCIQYDTEKHCFVSCESAKELKDAEKLEKALHEISAIAPFDKPAILVSYSRAGQRCRHEERNDGAQGAHDDCKSVTTGPEWNRPRRRTGENDPEISSGGVSWRDWPLTSLAGFSTAVAA